VSRGNTCEPRPIANVEVPDDKLWGAQTQRSLEHFSIGSDLMPREMITAHAILTKGAAAANYAEKRLGERTFTLTTQVCDEILAGQHDNLKRINQYVEESLMMTAAATRSRQGPQPTA
jgi:fumarate hydratase class II